MYVCIYVCLYEQATALDLEKDTAIVVMIIAVPLLVVVVTGNNNSSSKFHICCTQNNKFRKYTTFDTYILINIL